MTNQEAYQSGLGKMKDKIMDMLVQQSDPFISKILQGFELSDTEQAQFDQIKMLKDKIGRIEAK